MDYETKSKELLVSSYQVSASRIRQALNGSLTVNNSREPAAPPRGNDEVIGLCGQAGRHPYFRIPISVLESAIDEIEHTLEDSSSREVAIDNITSICQSLRRQTYFDSGTGCVNDEIPPMVPLLPPEEIWYNGRELPLDVWRLISFEFDLISSAVSSQVPISEFAFGSATQGGLMFASIMNQLKDQVIYFDASGQSMPPKLSLKLGRPIRLTVNAARLFFEAGCLLTPLEEQSFSRWFPAVRYLNWLSTRTGEFRVKDEFRSEKVDSRYKGLFAEEMAIGMMAIILTDRLNAIRINNTVEVIRPGSYRRGQPIADFVAECVGSELIIAESKGSLGRKVSLNRRERAKEQVRSTNLAFPGSSTIPLTFSSTIYFDRQKTSTHCIVEDPEPKGECPQIKMDTERAWRIAYAKALRFVGLDVAGRQVLRGEPARGLNRIDPEETIRRERDERENIRFRRGRMARERYGVDLILDTGPCGVSIDSYVFNILRNHGIREGIQEKLTHILFERSSYLKESHPKERSFLTSLGIGCVFYSDLKEEDHHFEFKE